MIYKTLKKVSDYCQVLDKSKYNPSQTINGVTFTKNDDGTFTANGTATANIDYRGVSYNAKENIIAGRKYLMCGCPVGGSENTYYFRLIFLGTDYGNGVIAELTDSGAVYYDAQIIVKAETVCDNLVFKPQLFDLTEMYGAGNEPTTVEQFRQDFPEELYDYKPYCFVKSYKTLLKANDDTIITSYKKSLVCKTKNLFDMYALDWKLSINNSYTYLRYFIGENAVCTISWDIDAYRNNPSPYALYFCINDGEEPSNLNRKWLYHQTVTSLQKSSITVKANSTGYIYVELNDGPLLENYVFNKLTKFQIELGDTATDYVPYGHL